MSDPTPIPIHTSGEMIADMLPSQHNETVETVIGLKGSDNIDLTTLNNLFGLILSAIDRLNDTVEDLAGTVELLNNNASQNAQQAQQIQLGAIGACCEDPAFGTGEVTELCQLSQDAIAFVKSQLLSIGATFGGVRLPTVDELIRSFTFVGVDGRSYQLLSVTEANRLLASLAALGVGGISDLSCLLTDEPLWAAVLELLGTSNSAEQSYIRIQALPTDGYDCSPGVARVFFAAFSPTLINSLWKEIQIWNVEPWEDVCNPDPEGTGYDNQTMIVSTVGEDTLYIIGPHFDTQAYPADGMHPRISDRPGATVWVNWCGNNTTNANKSIYIGAGTSSTPDGIFVEVPFNSCVDFIPPSDRFWTFYGYGREESDGVGIAAVTFAWSMTDAVGHCPLPPE